MLSNTHELLEAEWEAVVNQNQGPYFECRQQLGNKGNRVIKVKGNRVIKPYSTSEINKCWLTKEQ